MSLRPDGSIGVVDHRGVRRGACECGRCGEYEKRPREEGHDCAYCGCKVVQHRLLDEAEDSTIGESTAAALLDLGIDAATSKITDSSDKVICAVPDSSSSGRKSKKQKVTADDSSILAGQLIFLNQAAVQPTGGVQPAGGALSKLMANQKKAQGELAVLHAENLTHEQFQQLLLREPALLSKVDQCSLAKYHYLRSYNVQAFDESWLGHLNVKHLHIFQNLVQVAAVNVAGMSSAEVEVTKLARLGAPPFSPDGKPTFSANLRVARLQLAHFIMTRLGFPSLLCASGIPFGLDTQPSPIYVYGLNLKAYLEQLKPWLAETIDTLSYICKDGNIRVNRTKKPELLGLNHKSMLRVINPILTGIFGLKCVIGVENHQDRNKAKYVLRSDITWDPIVINPDHLGTDISQLSLPAAPSLSSAVSSSIQGVLITVNNLTAEARSEVLNASVPTGPFREQPVV
eukprot:TRINITY_DN2228_c0_g1_i1.p1 TRINITY_DN2228_c0_g1~~TRINITY_DN2228_c0_g1_i1.p1  ORF type:complete len:457 (+),score=-45.43 TRINITY_DN2228_c0_g1_i1:100-1470(+)